MNISKSTFQEMMMTTPSAGNSASSMPGNVGVGSTPTAPPMAGGKKVKKGGAAKKPSASKKVVPKKATKKGGALMDDVKNLAVPFAILLAKQGLQSMFDKKKTKKGGEVELEARSASKLNSQRRRTTIAGGSCGSSCAAGLSQFTDALTPSSNSVNPPQAGGAKKATKKVVKKAVKKPSSKKGGAEEQNAGARAVQVKSRFEKLSKEIDEFLQKY